MEPKSWFWRQWEDVKGHFKWWLISLAGSAAIAAGGILLAKVRHGLPWLPSWVPWAGIFVLSLLVLLRSTMRNSKSNKEISARTNSAPELKDEDKIKITLPPDGALTGRKPFGKASFSYAVYGTLKTLPDGCEIWLLNADKLGQQFWPQGFDLVPHNQRTGEWNGRINVPRGQNSVNIFAVVAPPTSQQLFRYYEEVGRERWKENEKRPEAERIKGLYAPLRRIPEECKNIASVLATVPPE